MRIFCVKCQKQQDRVEKSCLNCGTPYGGETWPIFLAATVVLLPAIIIYLDGKLEQFYDARIFFWYLLPIITAAAFLYDYHPTRRSIYFYGAALIIVLSIFFS